MSIYQYECIWRPGKLIKGPNALSRSNREGRDRTEQGSHYQGGDPGPGEALDSALNPLFIKARDPEYRKLIEVTDAGLLVRQLEENH